MDFLVDKYKTKQPGELWTTEKETKTMRKWRLKQKIIYADTVMDQLNMKGVQREQVHHLLNDISNLKDLCRNCSNEKIIAVISFYIKFCTTPKLSLTHYNRYKVCREHELSLELYSTIVSNIAKHFQSHAPLSPVRYVKG